MRQFLFLLFASLLVVACNQTEPEKLPPEQIVANSADRMIDLDGFRFTIDISGAPVFLDVDQNFSLASAEGFYVAPDKAIAAVRVLAPGLVTEVNILSVDQEQWLSGLVSDEWTALPPDWGFNPATLVDAESGFISTLTSDLSELELSGMSKLDGGPDQELFLISGTMDGGRISELSQGLISPDRLRVQLWIAPDTFELVRVVLDTGLSGETEETTVWQVDFRDFDQTVEISPPSS
ncbi:MAG: LppX_LprAFG lipoprotein [Chloroflexota bacterium]|jgi:hypothetical protein